VMLITEEGIASIKHKPFSSYGQEVEQLYVMLIIRKPIASMKHLLLIDNHLALQCPYRALHA